MQQRNDALLLIGSAVIVVIMWGLCWALSVHFIDDWPKRGTFGDMFGAVNALFSGLAFACIVATLFLQREELALQREELASSRAELHAQNDIMHKQQFENTFFSLLRQQSEIVEALGEPAQPETHAYFGRARPEVSGRDFFRKAYGGMEVIGERDHATLGPDGKPKLGPTSHLDIYDDLMNDYEHKLGHYFRNLYTLVKFIDQSQIEDKKLYTNIVRAQLSSYELLILFYNCLSSRGEKKFKPLIEKYALLKTVPLERLLEKEHKDLYGKNAYGLQS